MGVFHNRFFTSAIVLLHRNRFANIIFGNPKRLFNPELYWQSVGIPTGFSLDLETFLSFVTAKYVFDRSGHNVMNARHSVGRRRTLVKNKRGMVFSLRNTLVKNLLPFPEIHNFFRNFWQIQTFVLLENHFGLGY
ncbi:MAG: Uncharacterised protein [Flavobacteriaceae bacterium]|nr:MAG: Uncharacterised protein [Flavobacteriaceae bacterium]